MPVGIKKQGNVWVVFEKKTGKVKSRHKTKGKAQASAAARSGHKLSRMK